MFDKRLPPSTNASLLVVRHDRFGTVHQGFARYVVLVMYADRALFILRAAIGGAGFCVFNVRMRGALRVQRMAPIPAAGQLDVSLIVPARNEVANLPALLRSISALDPAPREVIVVDDHSTDGTAAVAAAFGARVVVAPPLPYGWVGKSWACAAGAAVAKSPLLLFTDADTVHAPDSLARALHALETEAADLISFVPAHIAVTFWEKLQGVFQLLLLVASGAGAKRAVGERRFCIGQYLLIRRAAYDRIGGHAALRHRVAEDLVMARLVDEQGLRFFLVCAPGALRVRMYPEGLMSFIRGWRRNFRDGIAAAGTIGMIETTLVVAWLLDAPRWLVQVLASANYGMSAVAACVLVCSWLDIAYWQRRVGSFRVRDALAYPLFAALFVLVSGLAMFDSFLRKPIAWKGRTVPLDQLSETAAVPRSAAGGN